MLVTGGRDYNDAECVHAVLTGLHDERPITLLIHGAARGADTLAGMWAAYREVPCKAMPADWRTHGKAAGPLRNQKMLQEKPDLVVAFPGGKGTLDMVTRALDANIEVDVVES